jgi:transposase
MIRHRLSHSQWEAIADLFPRPKATGRPRRDAREMFDAIVWILRTGSAWRDLPVEFGPWGTAWDTFDRWNGDGTLDAALERLRAHEIDSSGLDELWCVDGTVVRAARCAAGGGKKGIRTNRKTTRLDVLAAV